MAKPKKQIAAMIAMNDSGYSARAIGRELKWSAQTVTAYLAKAGDYLADPVVKGLIAKWRETEADDLVALRAKARARLHEKLDANKMRPLELIALQDRAFTQSRLIEGASTANVLHGAILKIQQDALAMTMKAISGPAKGDDSGRPRTSRKRGPCTENDV